MKDPSVKRVADAMNAVGLMVAARYQKKQIFDIGEALEALTRATVRLAVTSNLCSRQGEQATRLEIRDTLHRGLEDVFDEMFDITVRNFERSVQTGKIKLAADGTYYQVITDEPA